MRRVVFVNRYFAPDHSATSQMVSDLASYLATRGWNAMAITSRQRYDDPRAALPTREQIDGVEVRRIWTSSFGRQRLPGRALDYATFYASAFVAILRAARRGTVVVALTDPPLLSVVCRAAAAIRGAVVVNWLHDLFPDIAGALGMRLPSFLRPLRDASLRGAAANVVLGERMAERLGRLGVHATVRHNWAAPGLVPLPHQENALRREWGLEGTLVVGYSGNLGRAHDFETLLGAMKALAGDDRIRFLVVGGGAHLERVRAEAPPNVLFKPYQPRERLRESLSAADLHVVTLFPGVEGLMVPSKLYGVLAVGRGVLFVGARDGEVASIVARNECGFTFAPGDSAGLARAIRDLAENRGQVEQLGRRAREAYERDYARDGALQSWERILEEGRQAAAAGNPARQRLALAAGAVLAVAALAAVPFTVPREAMPNDLAGLVRWLRHHPADSIAANAITEQALDAVHPGRFALWKAAHAHAVTLAPARPGTTIAYVRSALFHWYELAPEEKRAALRAIEPLLRDETVFFSLYKPLWELTHDFAMLRRANPGNADALAALLDLAATNGRFADYRELRAALASKRLEALQRRAGSLSPAEIVRHVPPALTSDEEPLLRTILKELERRPLHDDPVAAAALDAIIDYSLRHGLGPLSGLEAVTLRPGAAGDPQRARLALRLGDAERAAEIALSSQVVAREAWIDYYRERAKWAEERGDMAEAATCRTRAGEPLERWTGLCGELVCRNAGREIAVTTHGTYEITIAPVARDEVPPYVEVYLDDVRVAEGDLAAERRFAFDVAPGLHRIEVRLVNPLTRNRQPRSVKIAADSVRPAHG